MNCRIWRRLNFSQYRLVTLGAWRSLKKLRTLDIDSPSPDATKSCLEPGAADSLEYLKLKHPISIIPISFFIGVSKFKKFRALNLQYCREITNGEVLQFELQELAEFIYNKVIKAHWRGMDSLIWMRNLGNSPQSRRTADAQ